MTITGLKRGTVKLFPYTPEWRKEALKTILTLKRILNNDAIDIQHVGSTAIIGISAKPIIDIAVAVKNFDDALKHNHEFEKNGIIYRRNDEREILYVMGDIPNDILTHHIHTVIYNNDEWLKYIDFRDYMNTHPDDAEKYSILKTELAKKYAKERKTYTAQKADFIAAILKKTDSLRNRTKKTINIPCENL